MNNALKTLIFIGIWVVIAGISFSYSIQDQTFLSFFYSIFDPPIELESFSSIDELIIFLNNDNISDKIYNSNFKCGDFADALVTRAHDLGYDMKVYSMFNSELDVFTKYVESLRYVKADSGVTITTTFNYGLGVGHAICKTKINSETYLIEPQNDMVFKVRDFGYDLIYFGEVTK